METRVYLITNTSDIERAVTMGIPEPEPSELLFNFHFRVKDVSAAYRHSANRIVIYLPEGAFGIEYNKELWDQITEHLR